MKCFTVLIILFSTFTCVFSQESEIENNYLIGGQFSINTQENFFPSSLVFQSAIIPGFYSTNEGDLSVFNFNLSPYIAKQFNEKWLFGLGISYGRRQQTIDDYRPFDGSRYDYKKVANEYGITLFGRYLINPQNKLQAYIQPGISYNFSKEKDFADDEVTQTISVNYITTNVGLGVLYQMTNRFQVRANLGNVSFLYGNWDNPDTDSGNSFNTLNSTFRLSSASFGFEYLF